MPLSRRSLFLRLRYVGFLPIKLEPQRLSTKDWIEDENQTLGVLGYFERRFPAQFIAGSYFTVGTAFGLRPNCHRVFLTCIILHREIEQTAYILGLVAYILKGQVQYQVLHSGFRWNNAACLVPDTVQGDFQARSFASTTYGQFRRSGWCGCSSRLNRGGCSFRSRACRRASATGVDVGAEPVDGCPQAISGATITSTNTQNSLSVFAQPLQPGPLPRITTT